jgi:hypothetical protein
MMPENYEFRITCARPDRQWFIDVEIPADIYKAVEDKHEFLKREFAIHAEGLLQEIEKHENAEKE